MIQPTKHGIWCTTNHNVPKLAAAIAHALGFPPGNKPTEFLGCVPTTAGKDRPQYRYVFLVDFRGKCVLACGESIEAVAAEIVRL